MIEHTRKLLTITTESALESRLTADIERLGARGYTVIDVRGKGSRGVRNASWEASGNIRLEVICKAEIAEVIVQHLWERYYDNYAMILTLTDVEVLRPEKF